MDIESLSKGLGLLSTTITTLKKLKDLIPSGAKKQKIEQGLKDAEDDLKNAEAEIAKGFNYQLCQRHFPPGIMLKQSEYKYICNICKEVEDDMDP